MKLTGSVQYGLCDHRSSQIIDDNSTYFKYYFGPLAMMKKSCDNCGRELSKFAFFKPDEKIYRFNSARLCYDCLAKITAHEKLDEA